MAKKIGKFLPNLSDGQSVTQDSASKKIVITGYQYLYNNSMADHVLVIDSIGNNAIRTNYLSTPGGLAKDLIQTIDKKFVVVGYEYSYQSIGGNNLMRSYAAKFSLNNITTPIWKVNYGKNTLYNGFFSLRETKTKELLILGTIDTLRILNINDNDLISLVKLDTNGQVKFQRLYNYKTNSEASTNYLSPTSLELTSDGGCIVSMSRINSPNPNPFIFVKYDANGCDSSTAHCATLNLVGVDELEMLNDKLEIYPNPASEFLNVEGSILNGLDANKTQINITDVSGREIQSFNLQSQEEISINIKNYEEGIYFVSLVYDTRIIKTKKIIIAR